MTRDPLRIVYLTSGAAGMFCGSCLNDNTLARALLKRGADIQLVPTYTPIRTDEQDVTSGPVFYGGVNVFLQQKSAIFRRLPAWITRWLDNRRILTWVTARGLSTSARELGALTVSMLDGTDGFQRREVGKLGEWLANSVQPDILHLSNLLIGGCLPDIRRRLPVKVVVTLQGDDIFLDSLPEPFQAQALERLRKLVPFVDRFLVHSRYYGALMADRLQIPSAKISQIPLTIDVADFQSIPRTRRLDQPLTIGYLARLAPEKGLGQLVDGFLRMRQAADLKGVQLRIAGWLGAHNREFAEAQFAKLRAAVLDRDWKYVGEVDRRGKVEFLRDIDLLCVPTTYREPKGLYVLEALAAGIPVVVPNHGAFPELIAATRGGQLVPPQDIDELALVLANLARNPRERRELAEVGKQNVLARHNSEFGAETLERIYAELT